MSGPSLFARQQAPLATPTNDGYMSADQAAKLAGLTPGSSSLAFQYTVQSGDDSDFTVTMPSAQANANYLVTPTIASGTTFTNFIIPTSAQTENTFQVLTDGVLPVGTLINFTVEELS
jgi:hypothetical protein